MQPVKWLAVTWKPLKNVLISIETPQSDWVMIETSYVERSLSVENEEASMGRVSFPNLSKKKRFFEMLTQTLSPKQPQIS